ncbi:hypothetical protein NDU88_004115 [Pleurodeles waltl]|uniref:Uncharacterized protein n=1 Tax=Pleurodeles waltl TaxID=8319 RepID=A0AAV7TR14_PLEWA|nr:hypothetical protein NDU88_004115 [Pleurodeles waltl]
MLGQRLRCAQGQQAFSLMGWLMEGVKQLYPTAIDVEESWGPWQTISEANEQLREMGMQNAVYSQQFLGPDVEPVTAGIRTRLIRNAPPHMKGALLALLGPTQGRPVGDVKWKALQRRQKEKEAVDEKQPSAPPMEESEKEKTESGKNRKVPVSTLYPDLSSDGWEVPDPLL